VGMGIDQQNRPLSVVCQFAGAAGG
jgi:hypothetical protein